MRSVSGESSGPPPKAALAAAMRLASPGVLVALGLSCAAVWACSVPVFRYALEYWLANPYEVVVFHRGPLAPADQVAFDTLAQARRGASHANLRVSTVDLAGKPNESMLKLWEAQAAPELPWIVVRYPRVLRKKEIAWSGGLNADAARALLDSPVRRDIARRILKGESCVWVLLESGDQEKDDAAAELLGSQLKRLEGTLELPDLFADDSADSEGAPALRVAFSTVRLSRADPAEEMLVAMLLHSERGLTEYSEPMAFPIFGRGRTLYALVGKGIKARNITRACGFLLEPCSCQIKAFNPGTDLLMSVDWGKLIAGRVKIDEALPPLTGFSELAALTEEIERDPAEVAAAPGAGSAERSTDAGTEAVEVSGALTRNLIVLALLAFSGVAAATMVLRRKRR